MMKILLFLSPFIAVGIVYFIKTRMQDKHRPYVLGSLWLIILTLPYYFLTQYTMSKFDEVKNADLVVIKNLKDIRHSACTQSC